MLLTGVRAGVSVTGVGDGVSVTGVGAKTTVGVVLILPMSIEVSHWSGDDRLLNVIMQLTTYSYCDLKYMYSVTILRRVLELLPLYMLLT